MARAQVLSSLTSLLLAYGTAHGETLVVPDQFPSIQVAITAAVEGDTVLVRPGTYQEALAWANKNLTLLGDGLEPPVIITANSTSTVMSVGPGVTQQTIIENLTIRDGRAEEGAGFKLVGASPAIRHCRFEANVAAVPHNGFGPSRGGAMFVSSGSSPVVTDCSFMQNQSVGSDPFIEWWGDGGAVYAESGGSVAVRRCRFEENEARGAPEGGFGAGICLNGVASAVIDSCTFAVNGFSYGGGLYSESQVAVRNCIFQDNYGWSGAALYANGTFLIENNQFLGNVTGGTEGGAITALGSGSITNNTIAFNEGWNEMAGVWAPEATVANNIIGENRGWGVIECPRNGPQAFTCNDVWGNTINGDPANYNGCDLTGTNGNISVDPLFCDADSADYHLLLASPCAPDNSPPGCGLIGALPVCGATWIEAEYSPVPHLELVIQPNPVTNIAEFIFGQGIKPRTLDVYDSGGRLVEQIQSPLSRITWMPPANIPTGVYYARLEVGGVSRAVKFALIR